MMNLFASKRSPQTDISFLTRLPRLPEKKLNDVQRKDLSSVLVFYHLSKTEVLNLITYSQSISELTQDTTIQRHKTHCDNRDYNSDTDDDNNNDSDNDESDGGNDSYYGSQFEQCWGSMISRDHDKKKIENSNSDATRKSDKFLKLNIIVKTLHQFKLTLRANVPEEIASGGLQLLIANLSERQFGGIQIPPQRTHHVLSVDGCFEIF